MWCSLARSYTTLPHNWLFLAYLCKKKVRWGFVGSLTNCHSSKSNEAKVFVVKAMKLQCNPHSVGEWKALQWICLNILSSIHVLHKSCCRSDKTCKECSRKDIFSTIFSLHDAMKAFQDGYLLILHSDMISSFKVRNNKYWHTSFHQH